MTSLRLLAFSLVFVVATAVDAASELWQEVLSPQVRGAVSAQARAFGSDARRYRVDDRELRALLQRVDKIGGPGSQRSIRLPMPDGSIASFEIYESPVMADELARKYPDIRTFKVYGIDDPLASGRLDITPRGFHAMLHTSQGRLFLDPYDSVNQPELYDARMRDETLSGHSCQVDAMDFPDRPQAHGEARSAARLSGKLRSYRLAVAATQEYVDEIFNPAMVGGRRSQTQAEIVTAINRVNEIYERDLGVFFELVGNNDQLIDEDGSGGLSNNTQALFSQNQGWIDNQIGNSFYDVGHAFSTGNGGLGWLGSACDNANKARGVSGIFDPTGDKFYIDFVAHEIGHQFNADHTFNGSTQSCTFARNAATAWEPGSGSSIMGYAGICGVENLQSNSDATLHGGSIRQINSFIAGAGSCFNEINVTPANPNHPQVSPIASKTIPANTTFVLDAVASDADGDVLSYQWDQIDSGCPTNASSFGTDRGDNALFRSYEPLDVSERHFPELGTQLRGFFDAAEVLSCQVRDLNFRLTVRDNISGVGVRDVALKVVNGGHQFQVNTFNTSSQIVTNPAPLLVEWNVAQTDIAPVSCPFVDIELMTLAPLYVSYNLHPLAMMTPNDGNEMVSITPATHSHPRARLRVKCSDNVFYDISDADFEIVGTGMDTFDDTANDIVYSNNVTTGTVAPLCGIKVTCEADPVEVNPVESSGGGSSAMDYRWLALLAGLLLAVRVVRRAHT